MTIESNEPLIPHTQSLPEITIKAVIISIFLTVLLTASNAYLGMKVGTTISASIPASVIAMGILHFFRRHNVLENNIIQTAASAGEATVAACIFTFPALLIIRSWFNFDYFTMAFIAIIGGTMGVLFSILLRRVLLSDKTLRFPEGVAIGNVLKASANKTVGLKFLVQGGIVGGIINFFQVGLRIFTDSVSSWVAKGSAVWGISYDFSPALLAAGYIVGANVGVSMLVGVIVGWGIILPILTTHYAGSIVSVDDTVSTIYNHYIRYIGVGTLLAGGIWTIVRLLKPICDGVRLSLQSMYQRKSNSHVIIRTESDIPINYAMWVTLLLLIPLCFLIVHLVSPVSLGISPGLFAAFVAFALLAVVVVGFIVASVSGYFAGLVGSTNNPLSSLVISATLLVAFIMSLLLKSQVDFKLHLNYAHVAATIVILLVAAISTAGAITNDTIQDLKAGQMVGATPWKQQIMLILGVIVSALVIPPVLQLLFQAYGIGGVFPHAGMDPRQMLSAPQATLVAAVATGIFGAGLDWNLIFIGGAIGASCIAIDEYLKRAWNTRLPVMAVGLAIYLPMSVTVPLTVGGILSFFFNRSVQKKAARQKTDAHEFVNNATDRIMLTACGLVAGASLMGVVLAIPFAIAQSNTVLSVMPKSLSWLATFCSVLSVLGLIIWLYKVTMGKKN